MSKASRDKKKKESSSQNKRTSPDMAGNLNSSNTEIKSDVLGSWTGAPLYGEQPVQDADDL